MSLYDNRAPTYGLSHHNCVAFTLLLGHRSRVSHLMVVKASGGDKDKVESIPYVTHDKHPTFLFFYTVYTPCSLRPLIERAVGNQGRYVQCIPHQV